MTSLQPFLQGAFDAETTKAMDEAYALACEELDVARGIIAQRIIEAARQGERDPQRLLDRALGDDFGITRRRYG